MERLWCHVVCLASASQYHSFCETCCSDRCSGYFPNLGQCWKRQQAIGIRQSIGNQYNWSPNIIRVCMINISSRIRICISVGVPGPTYGWTVSLQFCFCSTNDPFLLQFICCLFLKHVNFDWKFVLMCFGEHSNRRETKSYSMWLWNLILSSYAEPIEDQNDVRSQPIC